MIFLNYQKVIFVNEIPDLIICETKIERVTTFNLLGLTINEFINLSAHTSKIANEISRTLGVMNRLKMYLPIPVMKLMYDSLIRSHLQFGITCWGFECNRLFKLQKCALIIMINSQYNAQTEPLYKDLKLLKLDGVFDIQCMNFFYKFTNNTLPKYSHSVFIYNHDIYEIETSCTYLLPVRTVLKRFCGTISRNLSINFRATWPTGFILIVFKHFLSTWNHTLLILIDPFALIHSAMFVTISNMYNCTCHIYVLNQPSLYFLLLSM